MAFNFAPNMQPDVFRPAGTDAQGFLSHCSTIAISADPLVLNTRGSDLGRPARLTVVAGFFMLACLMPNR
jgi:hypothetical protein